MHLLNKKDDVTVLADTVFSDNLAAAADDFSLHARVRF